MHSALHVTLIMNLYTFKIEKDGQGKLQLGFCFRKVESGPPRLYDELLKQVRLKQDIEMRANKIFVPNGFLFTETTTPKLLKDKYEGQVSARALLHIKARTRGVEISPARSETTALLQHSWPDEGYDSWIYEMRTGDIMDILVSDDIYRMRFLDGEIECEKVDLD